MIISSVNDNNKIVSCNVIINLQNHIKILCRSEKSYNTQIKLPSWLIHDSKYIIQTITYQIRLLIIGRGQQKTTKYTLTALHKKHSIVIKTLNKKFGCTRNTHIYIQAHIHIHTHIHAYTYTHKYPYMHKYIYTDLNFHIYAYLHTFSYICIHTYIYIYTYIHIHAYIHIYIHI